MTTMTVPTPRYTIGQKVFEAGTSRTTETYPCPDCLGSGAWPITSPGGTKTEIGCPRCCYGQGPSLRYEVHVPSVRELTVASIQIDTAARVEWHDETVKYMCEETGVGTGRVYNQSVLFADRDLAEHAAKAQATAANAKIAEKPERLAQQFLGRLPIKEASIKEAEDAAQSLRYNVAYLIEDIEENLSEADDLDDARERTEATITRFREKHRGH